MRKQAPAREIVGHATTSERPELPGQWDDDEVVDQALRLVADHFRSLGALLGRSVYSPTIAELRQSPLGRDLRLVAGVARGGGARGAAYDAADRVLDVMLRPLAADETPTPVWFWQTALGGMLAGAERAAAGPDGVLSPAIAAAQLGVDPSLVDGWLADGALPAIPDRDGLPLVARREVDRRRAVARELAVATAEDDGLAEHRLAS